MITNMGNIDRVIRLAVALLLFIAAFGTGLLGSGALFWLALLVAGIFTLTAVVGSCPLYRLVGLKTCQNC